MRIGPLQLNHISTIPTNLPGTNVADFPVLVVIPASAGYRVRNRFADLVGRDYRECIKCRHSSRASRAVRKGKNRIIDGLAAYGERVMIPTEGLAGGILSEVHRHPTRRVEDVEGATIRAGRDNLSILDCLGESGL